MIAMAVRHLGLRAQIVLSLAALMTVVFSFTGMAVLWVLRSGVRAQRADSGEVAVRTTLEGLAARARSDPEGVRSLAPELEELVGRAGIQAIGIYDSDGEPLSVAGRDGQGPELRGVDPRRPRPYRVVRSPEPGVEEMLVIHPIGGGRGAVVAVVGFAMDGSELSRLARPVLIYLFASGGLLLLFGYWSLTRLIVRPLEMLTRATEKVSQGRLDVSIPVPARGGKEIAAAARAFNAMTKQLRDQQVRLASKVEALERTANELQATQDQLVRSAKLASVGSLAAGVAHEVGNPVSAILGLSEVLLDGDLEPGEGQEYLERIKREADRVNRIVRDLLEYARPTADDAEDYASVAESVDSAVGLLSPQRAYRDVDIQIVGDSNLPPVAIGIDELTQVLVNLMMNAADAVEGQGEVRVRFTQDATLKGPGGAEAKAVRVSVSDSGPGVPEQAIGRIFEPFYTTKDPGSGTGLGLALCDGIISRVGGRMDAENLPGGGLMITLVLPVTAAED